MIITTKKVMRPRNPHDFYPTPYPLARQMIEQYAPYQVPPSFVLDMGAGSGVFGDAARAAYPSAYITGVDIRPLSRPRSYDYWLTGGYDFLLNDESEVFDLVIGNPPYRYAEAFVRRGLSLLTHGGTMVLLLRLAFLEGQERGRGLWCEHLPKEVAVLCQRPSFTGDAGTDATAYAVFVWQKTVWQCVPPRLSWLDWK
jgi:hypothetical protein